LSKRPVRVVRSINAMAMVVVIGVALEAGAACMQHQDSTTVCAGGACWTHIYYYEACDSGGGDGGGGDPGPGPGGGGGSYYDQDGDGYIDEWRGVVATTDPCANNFDTNDRLGTNHGGPNDVRPNHSGVDIQADRGDPVFPFHGGTVMNVGWDEEGVCGYRVTIDHGDGTWSAYCHMVDGSSTLVPGRYVSAGLSQLGQVNSTGRSSGDHLHITWRGGDQRWEYFSCTGSQPAADQLRAGGC